MARSWHSPTAATAPAPTTTSCCGRPVAARWPGEVARLGEGESAAFSPDGKWLLAFVPSTPPRIVLYPTRTGAERRITIDPFESIGSADWFPDGKSILFCGNRVGEASRCYVQPLEGGGARAVTPAGTGAGFVS